MRERSYLKTLFSITSGFICCLAVSYANEATGELENLRIDIQHTETEISDARDEHIALEQELKENELATAKLSHEILTLRNSIKKKQSELKKMQGQKNNYVLLIQQQRKSLARQIQKAYIYGRTDRLKLILNQQDPSKLSRAMAYHDFFNLAHIKKMQTSMDQLNQLKQLEHTIQNEQKSLERTQSDRSVRLEAYQKARKLRHSILLKLERFISDKQNSLKHLLEQEKELSHLFNQIEKEQLPTISFFEDIAPFSSLRGKLPWPVSGKHIHRFGSQKKGGDLRWDGHYILAEAGSEVKVVSAGKVIYADWFRNLGLLMIIDHGDGYMSLYGHNQNLYKKRGDFVLNNEVIASVGDSGGQIRAGLYFEIRQGAHPQNPALWCKK